VGDVGRGELEAGMAIRAALATCPKAGKAGLDAGRGVTSLGVVTTAAGWVSAAAAGSAIRCRGVGVTAGCLPPRLTMMSPSALGEPVRAAAARSASRSAANASGRGRKSRGAGERPVRLAADVAVRALAERNISPETFDGLFFGTTVPSPQSFYAAPWAAAMIGNPDITGPTIMQACATSARLIGQCAGEVDGAAG